MQIQRDDYLNPLGGPCPTLSLYGLGLNAHCVEHVLPKAKEN